jgi:hypothetical protein
MTRLLEVGLPLPPAAERLLGPAVCTALQQRNWSRVGLAVGPAGGSRYFLKQSVDRSGAWHAQLWRHELEGLRLAERVLEDIAIVPRVLGTDESHLLTVHEYIVFETPDELLRREPAALARSLPEILGRLTAVIDALAAPPADALVDLPRKARPFGGAPTALNFKGFDIRNCGIVEGAQEPPQRLVLFDLGRPYLAPREELAAKLLVSVGLLNWGAPLTRFLRGPDIALLELARETLGARVERAAVVAEIELQRGFRLRELKARDRLEELAKALVVRTVGRRYLDRLEQWARRLPT